MSFYTLTSYNGNGSQVHNFNQYNTTANFKNSFREPIVIEPYSYIRLNFFSAYLTSDANKRSFFVLCPTFTSMSSQMGEIGKCGVLGIQRLPDGVGSTEPGTKNSYVNNSDYPYVAINNAERMYVSEIEIKVVWEDGSICDNLDGYNYSTGHSQEEATSVGLHIIPSTFNKII